MIVQNMANRASYDRIGRAESHRVGVLERMMSLPHPEQGKIWLTSIILKYLSSTIIGFITYKPGYFSFGYKIQHSLCLNSTTAVGKNQRNLSTFYPSKRCALWTTVILFFCRVRVSLIWVGPPVLFLLGPGGLVLRFFWNHQQRSGWFPFFSWSFPTLWFFLPWQEFAFCRCGTAIRVPLGRGTRFLLPMLRIHNGFPVFDTDGGLCPTAMALAWFAFFPIPPFGIPDGTPSPSPLAVLFLLRWGLLIR